MTNPVPVPKCHPVLAFIAGLVTGAGALMALASYKRTEAGAQEKDKGIQR